MIIIINFKNDLATRESFRDLTPYKESDLDLEQGPGKF